MMKLLCLFVICMFSLSTIYSIPNKEDWQTVEDDITDVLGELTKLHEQVKDIEVRQLDQEKVNDGGIVKRSKHAVSLQAGSSIVSGDFIVSNNYNNAEDADRVPFYSARMEEDGNFVVYLENDLIEKDRYELWSTGTADKGVSDDGLIFESSGNLALLDDKGNYVWQSYTSGGSASTLYMADDGRLVIRWASVFVWGAGYLLPDTVLPVGESLFNGQYRAQMKGNGNFILWDADGTKLCSTKTAGNTYNLLEGLRMTSFGDLEIRDKNSNELWHSGTETSTTYDGDRLQLTDTPSLQVIAGGLQFESYCTDSKDMIFEQS